jgi:hypothetical protein
MTRKSELKSTVFDVGENARVIVGTSRYTTEINAVVKLVSLHQNFPSEIISSKLRASHQLRQGDQRRRPPAGRLYRLNHSGCERPPAGRLSGLFWSLSIVSIGGTL